MTAPSNANTSWLEVVAWRWREKGTPMDWRFEGDAPNHQDLRWNEAEPLVTAASAQARIAELEAEVKKLRTIMKGREELATGLSLDMNALAHDVAADMADRATAAEARADRLAASLIEALPYVESCEYDNGYKPGAVLRVVKNIQSALQQEG